MGFIKRQYTSNALDENTHGAVQALHNSVRGVFATGDAMTGFEYDIKAFVQSSKDFVSFRDTFRFNDHVLAFQHLVEFRKRARYVAKVDTMSEHFRRTLPKIAVKFMVNQCKDGKEGLATAKNGVQYDELHKWLVHLTSQRSKLSNEYLKALDELNHTTEHFARGSVDAQGNHVFHRYDCKRLLQVFDASRVGGWCHCFPTSFRLDADKTAEVLNKIQSNKQQSGSGYGGGGPGYDNNDQSGGNWSGQHYQDNYAQQQLPWNGGY